MGQKELSDFLKPWRKRLRQLAAGKALMVGLMTGAAAFAIAMLLQKLLQKTGWFLPAVIGGLALLLAFAAAYLLLRPTEKTTAEQLDRLGLHERAATMVALREDDSEMARLQREDALGHIRSVKPACLRNRIGWLMPVLCAAMLLLACGSVLAPEHWFAAKAQNSPAGVVSDDILNSLKEEQESLQEQGEEAMADLMESTVSALSEADSELEAAGILSSAQAAAQNAAAAGTASESASQEAQEALQSAMESLTGQTAEDGESVDEASEGSESDSSESREGEAQDGQSQDGEAQEEDAQGSGEAQGSGGSRSGSASQPQGQSRGGSGEESTTNMTEQIYDPISGSVQYGDVYSAYYAEYLQDARSGSVPGDLQDAADAYFDSLNQ